MPRFVSRRDLARVSGSARLVKWRVSMLKTTLFIATALGLAAGCAPHATRSQFPSRISAANIPAADRLATDISRLHRGLVTTKVALCVAPSGDVKHVDLVDSSGLEAYDQAVLDTVAGWQFHAAPAEQCEKLSVTYRTP
jgi:TonB family protein